MITIDDFSKVEIRAGKILKAEPIPESNKLLKLEVDFGEEKPRQVLSGIAKYFPDITTLVGRTVGFVTNLEPRLLLGLESQAMILAVSTEEGTFSLLSIDPAIPPGTYTPLARDGSGLCATSRPRSSRWIRLSGWSS